MNWQLAPDDPLFEKYRIERCLGVGGMGAVFEAQHLQLQHRVAIKLLYPELATRADVVARFVREGRATARLRSPHVVRVLDVGRGSPGAAYLVMEYLDGEDLEEILKRRGPLPVSEAAGYLLQVCEAMYEAHGMGIVHRDLKPANLFLTRDVYGNPCIKVLDFGISKVPRDSEVADMSITANATVVGTPLYMPPEQMRGAELIDGRADIWALGAIFYELVTGAPAWSGSTLSEICVRVASDPTPRAVEMRPELPTKVDAVVSRCLRKDVKERYSDVYELAADLASFVPASGAQSLSRMRRLQELGTGEVGTGEFGAGVVGAESARRAWSSDTEVLTDIGASVTDNVAANDTSSPARTGVLEPRGRESERRPFRWVASALVLCAVGASAGAAWATRGAMTQLISAHLFDSVPSAEHGASKWTASVPAGEAATAADLERGSDNPRDHQGPKRGNHAVNDAGLYALREDPVPHLQEASQVPATANLSDAAVQVAPVGVSETVPSVVAPAAMKTSTHGTRDDKPRVGPAPRSAGTESATSRGAGSGNKASALAAAKGSGSSAASSRDRFAPDWGGRK